MAFRNVNVFQFLSSYLNALWLGSKKLNTGFEWNWSVLYKLRVKRNHVIWICLKEISTSYIQATSRNRIKQWSSAMFIAFKHISCLCLRTFKTSCLHTTTPSSFLSFFILYKEWVKWFIFNLFQLAFKLILEFLQKSFDFFFNFWTDEWPLPCDRLSKLYFKYSQLNYRFKFTYMTEWLINCDSLHLFKKKT